MKNILENRYVMSSVQTFLSVFLTTAGLQLTAGGIEWTSAAWFSFLLVAVRAAIKAVIESYAGKPAA